MEDDEHYVDDPNNPQYHHHGGEYAYQGGNSGGDFEGEGFQGEHEGYEASGNSNYIPFFWLSLKRIAIIVASRAIIPQTINGVINYDYCCYNYQRYPHYS